MGIKSPHAEGKGSNGLITDKKSFLQALLTVLTIFSGVYKNSQVFDGCDWVFGGLWDERV